MIKHSSGKHSQFINNSLCRENRFSCFAHDHLFYCSNYESGKIVVVKHSLTVSKNTIISYMHINYAYWSWYIFVHVNIQLVYKVIFVYEIVCTWCVYACMLMYYVLIYVCLCAWQCVLCMYISEYMHMLYCMSPCV